MTQTIFRRILLLTLLLVMISAFPAVAGKGQIYTIKKGDTLWGISQRFIDDPYYWPNLWADNPEITNPHLIFPGQEILIRNGRLEIVPAYQEAKRETTPEEKIEEPIAQEAIQIQAAGGSEGFIRTREDALGILVDSVDNRMLLTKGDVVFLKMHAGENTTVGDTYGLYKNGDPVIHPHTNEEIGVMANNLGYLQITGSHKETVVAKVGEVYREVERGAELFEYLPPRTELTLKRAPAELKGYVIASRDQKLAFGSKDIIFIDLGSDDGIESGNLFYISRPRQVSTEILEQAGEVDLPDAVLGAAVVIEPRAKTASAVIIKSVDAMHIGDNVTLATE